MMSPFGEKENKALNELLTLVVEFSAGMGCAEMNVNIIYDQTFREIECTAKIDGVTCRTMLSFEAEKPGREG